MTKEKIAVVGGVIISWIIAAKTVHRVADTAYLGGHFFAGWPIEVRFGLATPTGTQVFWAAVANSWVYVLIIWVVFTLVLQRIHK